MTLGRSSRTSADGMALHHDKHHAAYVKGANTAHERLAVRRPEYEAEVTFHATANNDPMPK